MKPADAKWMEEQVHQVQMRAWQELQALGLNPVVFLLGASAGPDGPVASDIMWAPGQKEVAIQVIASVTEAIIDGHWDAQNN